MRISPKKRNYQKGVELVIDIEVDGTIYKLAIPCPICKKNDWFLSENRTVAYCGNCHQHLGYIKSDIADMENVGWNIPGV